MQQLNYMQPVNPRNPIMETLQYYDMFGKLKDQSDARQINRQNMEMAQLAAEQKAKRQETLAMALDSVNKNPTRENYMALSNLYAEQDPEKAKAFRENWNVMDTGAKETMLKDSVNFLYQLESDPELAIKDLEERALAEEKSNRTVEAKKTRSMISMIKTSPQAVKNSTVMLIGGLGDEGKQAIDGWVNWSEEQRAGALAELAKGGKLADPKDVEAAENLLRKEYDGKQAVFNQVKRFNDIINVAETSGIGDLALIFTYMKLLDPTSVVREGEVASAANAGGVDSGIRAAYNQAIGTGKIDEKVRNQILSQSGKIFEKAKVQHELDKGFYTDIAKRRGLNVENIIYSAADAASKPAGTTPAAGLTFREYAKQARPQDVAEIAKYTDEELKAKFPRTFEKYNAEQGGAQTPEPVVTGSFGKKQ